MAWELTAVRPGPTDDALRRAGLQRWAEENTWQTFRSYLAQTLNVNPDHTVTKDDVERLKAAGWPEKYLKIVRAYIGFPVKWVGAYDDGNDNRRVWNEVPRRMQIAYLLARHVGKNITQTFTDDDLKTIARKLNLTPPQVEFLRPLVGKPFLQGANDMAQNLVDTFLNLQFGLPTGGGVNPIDSIGNILRFMTDSGNWLAIGAIVLGLALAVYGGRRWLEGVG